MTSPIAHCWAKLDWAKHHVDALKDDVGVEAAKGKPPFGIRTKFDSDASCIILLVSRIEPMPVPWSLMIGDACFNFRATLDYLAWHLVSIGATPISNRDDAKGVYFPLCLHKNEWNAGNLAPKLPGVQDRHLAVIERYQPYKAGGPTKARLEPLMVLSNVNRADKHQDLEPVFARHTGEIPIHFSEPKNFIPGRVEVSPEAQAFVDSVLLYPGAELARIYGTRREEHPEPDVKVEIKGSGSIAFRNGLWVVETLDLIGATITKLFSEIEPLL